VHEGNGRSGRRQDRGGGPGPPKNMQEPLLVLRTRLTAFADGTWLDWFFDAYADMVVAGDDLSNVSDDLSRLEADSHKGGDLPGKGPTFTHPTRYLVKRLTTGTKDQLPEGGWLRRLNLYWTDFPEPNSKG
ncbi:MAG: hypothetical protein V3R81_02095, partial [Gammaproteobacteria bacterium]